MTTSDRLPIGLLILTGVTGVIDAVSFLGLGHVFTANMTGNVVFLGFAVAGAPGLSIARNAVSLAAFLVGAVGGGVVGRMMAAHTRRRWLLAAAVAEATLLCGAAVASIGIAGAVHAPTSRVYTVIALTAVAMGIRSSTVRRLAVPDLNTTVLTMTLTGLAADAAFAGGDNVRFARRVLSVAAMFLGAVTGALLLTRGLAVPLALSAICVIAVTYLAVAEP